MSKRGAVDTQTDKYTDTDIRPQDECMTRRLRNAQYLGRQKKVHVLV
jgi:hypothetical protein